MALGHCIMESVASMDESDRQVMLQDFGDEPWLCDAGEMTWRSRPQLYWISWQLSAQEDITRQWDAGCSRARVDCGLARLGRCLRRRFWIKVDPTRPFPTLTTSRPRSSLGHKPTGLHTCKLGGGRALGTRRVPFPSVPVYFKEFSHQQAQ